MIGWCCGSNTDCGCIYEDFGIVATFPMHHARLLLQLQ
jgi:hypothetical protein